MATMTEAATNKRTSADTVTIKDAARAESTTIASLRDVQFKDTEGNPIGKLIIERKLTVALLTAAIAEPDLSNPTRPRWERPLDTIRSFERAIDGDYKRRSMSRTRRISPRSIHK